jgi:hypothetical protein
MRAAGVTVLGAAAALVLAAVPGSASAQQAAGWWEWALPQVVEVRGDQQIISLPRGDQRARRGGRGSGGAPAFCRSGEGHPVFGRQWCRDKGFGLGGVLGPRWETRRWDDVVLRAPRGSERRPGTVGGGGLIDILGDVVYGRLVAEGSRLGAGGPLTGRWLATDGAAAVLQIRAGGVPLAELTDLTGDRRVDAILISRR